MGLGQFDPIAVAVVPSRGVFCYDPIAYTVLAAAIDVAAPTARWTAVSAQVYVVTSILPIHRSGGERLIQTSH